MGAIRTGGQGSVYKGRRTGAIMSAVKLLPTPIHTEDASDRNFKNFNSEVEKLRKVNELPNPNVVKILSSGLSETGSFPYIEMEFIEGPDLEELLKPPHDGVFTLKEVLKVADHLANALAHCHLVGVKHGDIKINNVKYNIHTGNYVLLDFGLAIMTDEQRRTSIRHAGAIEFMAPEQNTGVMLMQTDIYSYGIILYELLAGQVPFPLHDNGETARNAVMIAHMESPVPDLMPLRRENLPEGWTKEKREHEMRVPQWLLKLIATCLQKEPEKRYANGMALQEALFLGSIEAEYYTAGAQNIELLKKQNDRLAEQIEIMQLKEKAIRRSAKISRTWLVLMLFVFLGALGFGGYGVFKKSAPLPIPPTDTLLHKVRLSALNKRIQFLKAHKDTVLVHDTIYQPIVTQRSDSGNTGQDQDHHKKRRKKFLGIF